MQIASIHSFAGFVSDIGLDGLSLVFTNAGYFFFGSDLCLRSDISAKFSCRERTPLFKLVFSFAQYPVAETYRTSGVLAIVGLGDLLTNNSTITFQDI
mmetsp:Transcript_54102/g.113111  ORF Transcript_54102/g.113111 Transcript_54102/m.113111 type:complete len:98 (-) Transcript_54102:16-309(-)